MKKIIILLMLFLFIPLTSALAVTWTPGATKYKFAELTEGQRYVYWKRTGGLSEYILVFKNQQAPAKIQVNDFTIIFDSDATYYEIRDDGHGLGDYYIKAEYTDKGEYGSVDAATLAGTETIYTDSTYTTTHYVPAGSEPDPEPEPDPDPDPDTEPPDPPEDGVTPEVENQDSLMDKLKCLLQETFYWILEKLLALLEPLIGLVIALLPKSPFKFDRLEWGDFGQLIGYFLPVAQIMGHFILLLICLSVYYGLRHLLRLLQTIR